MLKRFLKDIKKHALFEDGDKLLLAISGGIDSMVLWDLVEKGGFDYAIAHCNFKLRGEESDADEDFIRQCAEEKGCKLYVKSFQTNEYSEANGVSTQMAARDLRYTWFSELMDQEGIDLLVTAHHLNDNVETVLLNQMRGTSIFGLTGMSSHYSNIVRPLLSFDKNEIQSYAAQENIQWREDSSNRKTDYKRNFIRHEIIPQLETQNPNFIKTFAQNIERNREVESVFAQYLDHVFNEIFIQDDKGVRLLVQAIIDNEIGPLALHKMIEWYGFNYSQSVDILEALDSTGAFFLSEHFQLSVDREYLFILPKRDLGEKVSAKIENWMELKELLPQYDISVLQKPFSIDTSAENVMIDYQKLSFPITLRSWNKGDKIKPLGMKNEKLISDLLINSKVPLQEKSSVLLIESSGEIACVIGHRINEDFKIESDTQEVLYLSRRKG